jgi:hypothetical protein
MISTWLLSSESQSTWFPCIFERERDVYIQVLLLFRRHGLSGFPDSLGQFRAYNMRL